VQVADGKAGSGDGNVGPERRDPHGVLFDDQPFAQRADYRLAWQFGDGFFTSLLVLMRKRMGKRVIQAGSAQTNEVRAILIHERHDVIPLFNRVSYANSSPTNTVTGMTTHRTCSRD
jgi:hypothetical protein